MTQDMENKTPAQPSGAKKAWAIIQSVLTWILVIAAVAMMIFTVISVNTFDRNDRAIFGYNAYIVRSDSMKATDFAAGDLVLVKKVDPATLKEGDIITYQSTNAENYGELVTHKIRRLTTDAMGEPAFVTYGTTTNEDDDSLVTYAFVRGKYQFAIPYLGSFFSFLKTTPGYIVCIFLPFLLLIGMQGYQSVKLFKQYKAEQLAQLEEKRQAERKELEEERKKLEQQQEESRKMMAELLALQQQLKDANAPAAPQEPSQGDNEA